MATPHRYWRINVSPRSYVSEVEMSLTPSGANACTGGTILYSSYTAGYEHTKAFDGTKGASNGWISATADPYPYIGYDFGTARDIQEFRIWTMTSSTLPTGFAIESSDDNVLYHLEAAYLPVTLAYGSNYAYAARVTDPVGAIAPALGTVHQEIPYPAAWPPTYAGGIKPVIWQHRYAPYTGSYYIAGTVTSVDIPVRRTVVLINETTKHRCGEMVSGLDGSFRFDYLAAGKYTVIGEDKTGAQNSIIYANVAAVAM